jgi:hypothetical protein
VRGLGALLVSLVLGVLGVIALLLVLGTGAAARSWTGIAEGPINDPGCGFYHQDSNGQAVYDEDVGPAATGDGRTITGHVFYDLNASGHWDAGEAGAPGVTVRTTTGLTATTDAGGGYELHTSSEPAMSVTIEIPPGYVATTPISVPVPAVTGTYTVDFGIRVAVYLPFVVTSYRASPIINGGFEEGWTGWTHGGELSQTVTSTSPHSGNYFALLGSPDYPCRDVPVGRAWMEQTVVVPSTGSPKLSFWYRIFTYDRNRYLSNTYDLFDVKINGVRVFADMNTTEPYGCQDPAIDLGWRQAIVALSGYRGSCITIRFENWNRPDPHYNTWTYVDDVRITDP